MGCQDRATYGTLNRPSCVTFNPGQRYGRELSGGQELLNMPLTVTSSTEASYKGKKPAYREEDGEEEEKKATQG